MSKAKLIVVLILFFVIVAFAGSGLLNYAKGLAFTLLRNRYRDSNSVIADSKPYIEFVKLGVPKSVRQGENFLMSAYFKPLRHVDSNYMLFVHLYTGMGKGWINADRVPIPATSEWPPHEETKIGPIQIFIDENAPVGIYFIEMGLFYSKKVSGDIEYFRLPYTNKREHIVGKIKIIKKENVTEKSKIEELTYIAKKKQGISDYCVGIEGPVKKIRRSLIKFSSPVSSEVNISAARNEYEAFQLILAPLKKNLKNVTVSATPLEEVNGKGTIDVKNITFNPVGYIRTDNVADYPVEYVGFWPDPLLESKEVNVILGEVQPLWFTVYVPKDVPSGYYKGFIELRPEDSEKIRIELKLRIYDFSLPEVFHLRTAFDLYNDLLGRYYNTDNQEQIRELELVHYDAMLRHRMNPIYVYDVPRKFRDSTGALCLDLEGFDRHMFFCLRRGLNAFSIARRWGGENENQWGHDKEVQEVLLAYADYLKMRKLFDVAYVYAFDEPQPYEAKKIRHITKLIHQTNPDIKIMVSTYPDEIWGNDIDIWSPQISKFRPEAAKKEREKGKEIWWFVSGVRPGTPAFNIDQHAIEHRVLFWMNWKFKVTGLLYWCVNYWYKNPWETAETWPNQNGNGSLFYPGSRGPVDSIRVEVIRDGIEDYEYLYILNKLVEHLKQKNLSPDLVKEAKQVLDVDSSIVKTIYEYTKDPEILLEERKHVAELIEKAKLVLESEK